jgi:hypothetical protein
MLNVTGSFSGSIQNQSVISVNDEANHSIGLAEIAGKQSSSDPKWNDCSIRYWGSSDVRGAQGVQRGYFLNDHGPVGKDRGTFEGKVSIVAGQVSVEGTWEYTGGEGMFAGIKGSGTFKTRLTSPTTVEATWLGAYELAGVASV